MPPAATSPGIMMYEDDQQRQNSLVVLSIILTTMSTFIVALRSIVRFIIVRKPGYDEYTIIVALVFTMGYMAEIMVLRDNHVGFPATTLTSTNMLRILQTTVSIELTYYIIVGFIKTSILCMYLRFAVTDIFRYLCYGTIIFQLAFTAICLCVTLSQCQPLTKSWDLTGTQPGSCINTTAFFYTTSGVNIITDLWIIALPIKTLNGTYRPLKEKIALGLIFGAGFFATIMSIVRLQSIYIYTLASDPFRDAIAVNLFSQLEINVAILCASVPALKPIFTPRRLQDFRNGKKYQHQHQHQHQPRHARRHSKLGSSPPPTGGGGGFRAKRPSPPGGYHDSLGLADMRALGGRSSRAAGLPGGTGSEDSVVFDKAWFPPSARRGRDADMDEVVFDFPHHKAFHPV